MSLATLCSLYPLDPADGTRHEVRVCSRDDRRLTGLSDQKWVPAITKEPALGMSLWSGDFSVPSAPARATIEISTRLLKGHPDWALVDTWYWNGAPVTIYAEEAGSAWPWVERFVGEVSSINREGETLRLQITVDLEPFEEDILTATYAGTGDAEGGADLKNQVKPLIIGHAKNVEPILINEVDNVYQFSAYGPIEAVDALFERAGDFGAPQGDHADYAALVAATVEAGQWATCLAEGLVRLGAPAAGVITGDVRGHEVSGATPRLSGAIIQALATVAGVDVAKIDTASLDAMDVTVPFNANVVVRSQATWRSLANQMALACNHMPNVALTGEFFVANVGFNTTAGDPNGEQGGLVDGSDFVFDGSSRIDDEVGGGEFSIGTVVGPGDSFILHAQGNRLPLVFESTEQKSELPFSKLTIGYARNWRVHSPDEIAFTAALEERGLYSATETYREGNIVSIASGARYLYIATTPSSGNDPAASPAFWAELNGQITPQYADGTVIDDLRPAEDNADVTTSNETILEAPAGHTFPADSAGDIISGLPKTFRFRFFRGAIDDSPNTDFTLSGTGFTATIDNTAASTTRGQVTVTALSAVEAPLTVEAGTHSKTITLAKNVATEPPPVSGAVSSKSVNVQEPVSNTTYGTSAASEATIALQSGNKLVSTAVLQYDVLGLGSATISGKWQHSPTGTGTWTDFATEVTGSNSFATDVGGETFEQTGFVSVNQEATGLAAGDYDVRLLLRRSAGTIGADVSGPTVMKEQA